MDYIDGGFYVIKDEFFSYVNDPNLLTNHENGARPHYLSFRDNETGLLLMVPCLAKVAKYKKIYERLERYKDNCYNLSQKKDIEKRERGFRFYTLAGINNVMVFEKMFYIYESYIERPYKTKNSVAVISPDDYESIQNQVIEVLGYIKEGFKFLKNQPDFGRIEWLMLEAKAKKEMSQI